MASPSTDPAGSTARPAAPMRDVSSGVLIAVCAGLAVFGMAHHPNGSAHGGAGDQAQALTLSRIVHGGLLFVFLLMSSGYVGFAQSCGLTRPLVRLGLVAHLFGSLAFVLAGLVNGFVFSAMTERYADGSAETREMLAVALAWGWELNQALAVSGVLALCCAIFAWSVHLVRFPVAWRILGILGLALALGFAVLFLRGALEADVRGFGRFVFAYAAWSVVLGILLARRTSEERVA